MNVRKLKSHGLAVFGGLLVAGLLALSACGGGSSSSGGTPPVQTTPQLSLLAGNAGGDGNADGTGPSARFAWPRGVAVDGAGNVYVADTQNHTIRKITPAGVVTTLAGAAGVAGATDGTGTAARLNAPGGIAVDSAGTLYVADSGNNVIRKITPEGAVTTLAGTAGVEGAADGTGPAASFYGPLGVAVDSTGTLYVTDASTTVRRITSVGVVTTLAGTSGVIGHSDGTGPAASFDRAEGIAVDSAGTLYVADSGNSVIRKITPAGLVTTLAGTAGVVSALDGTGPIAGFAMPNGIAADGAGNVYVTDTYNHTIRKITPAGLVTTLAGSPSVDGSTDGTGSAARFNEPAGISIDRAGNLVVADWRNQTIRKITPAGVVTTLAGLAPEVGYSDGTGPAASFTAPMGVASDGAGNVYLADRRIIRRITSAGTVTTLAGSADKPGAADGTGAAASFDILTGLAVDRAGNVFATQSCSFAFFEVRANCNVIRKITPSGQVTTLAGTAGVTGSSDGTGSAASFNRPSGIAADSAGNLYVADTANSIIRKITPVGVVTTLAGTAGVAGHFDGTGPAARFSSPVGLTIDSADSLYVTDGDGTIRKITLSGVVTTLAGTANVVGYSDGTGAAATFNRATGIAADSAGNLYVADLGNNLIRKITPAGVVSTLVGTAGSIGFVAGDLPGVIKSPLYVAVSGNTLYFTLPNGVATVTGLH